jgi:hypothetical protein
MSRKVGYIEIEAPNDEAYVLIPVMNEPARFTGTSSWTFTARGTW